MKIYQLFTAFELYCHIRQPYNSSNLITVSTVFIKHVIEQQSRNIYLNFHSRSLCTSHINNLRLSFTLRKMKAAICIGIHKQVHCIVYNLYENDGGKIVSNIHSLLSIQISLVKIMM